MGNVRLKKGYNIERSEVSKSIETAKEVFKAVGINLPPFAFWTVDDWLSKGPEADEIRLAQLGWDVTDFGHNDFQRLGRTLFTLRNGHRKSGDLTKVYAEKLILNPPNQCPPFHCHHSKMEDITNRAGGNIMVQLYMAAGDGKCSDEDFTVQIDSQTVKSKAGAIVRLEPGESLCLPPYMIHQFWGEEGTGVEVNGLGYTVSGEISSICDDWHDNYFLEPCERFCKIEEDEPRKHYLCNEYPEAD